MRASILLGTLVLIACSKTASKPSERNSLPQGAPPAVADQRRTDGDASAAAHEADARPAYNVVFILIDSLRADMPWTGYERPIAPSLTELAKKSTLYPRAYSMSSYTAKSVAPALVGKYPSEMGRDGYFFTKWSEKNLFIGERLQKANRRTLAGHAHGYFLPRFGTNQGFDDYRLLPGTQLQSKVGEEITGERLTEHAKQMLSDEKNVAQDGGKRFFAYFHYLDPHHEYAKHREFSIWGNDRRARYDGEVRYTDKWVGALIDWALTQPWGKNTAFVVSADHGEGFGERNHIRHAYEVWEALVRVPLIIHVPGAEPRRIETARSHIDLVPTILDLMRVEADPPLSGKSLVPEVFGAEAAPRPIVTELPRCDLQDRRRALIDGDYKLIAFGDDKSFMLFDVKNDFKEERELSDKEPAKLEQMKKLYREISEQIPVEPAEGKNGLKGAPFGRRW